MLPSSMFAHACLTFGSQACISDTPVSQLDQCTVLEDMPSTNMTCATLESESVRRELLPGTGTGLVSQNTALLDRTCIHFAFADSDTFQLHRAAAFRSICKTTANKQTRHVTLQSVALLQWSLNLPC